MSEAAGLHYFSHGDENKNRPPVIFLHGAGGNYLSWPPQLRHLKGQRIFAPDLPGHGKSGGAGRRSISDYASDVIEFMNALALPSAVLVGHSMGAAIALMLAIHQPQFVSGLCLIGGGAKMRVAPAILDLTSHADTFPNAVDLIVNNSFSQYASPRLKELTTQRMLETRPSVLHADFMACNAFDVMSDLSRVKTRTLILCGAEDKMTPPKFSEFLRGAIPGAELEIIPDAGHMLMLEKPDEVAALLERFLIGSN